LVPPTATPTEEIPPTETPTNVFVETLTVAPAEGGDAGNAAAPPPTVAPPPTAAPASGQQPCLRANLETETIPDGTELYQYKEFTKVWRNKNTGSCTWNSNYVLRFITGDLMNASSTIPLTENDVPPWGFLEVEVPMRAPKETGTYRGDWKIVSDTGKIFGFGLDGKGTIWVEIVVIDD
jgi:hypothetical protein